jgi:hypothetical protein
MAPRGRVFAKLDLKVMVNPTHGGTSSSIYLFLKTKAVRGHPYPRVAGLVAEFASAYGFGVRTAVPEDKS